MKNVFHLWLCCIICDIQCGTFKKWMLLFETLHFCSPADIILQPFFPSDVIIKTPTFIYFPILTGQVCWRREKEVAISGLMVYLKENEKDFFKEQNNKEQICVTPPILKHWYWFWLIYGGDGDIASEVMRIVSRVTTMSDPANAKMVTEGIEVLKDLDVPRTCALLMGLTDAFNLTYPKELKILLRCFRRYSLSWMVWKPGWR